MLLLTSLFFQPKYNQLPTSIDFQISQTLAWVYLCFYHSDQCPRLPYTLYIHLSICSFIQHRTDGYFLYVRRLADSGDTDVDKTKKESVPALGGKIHIKNLIIKWQHLVWLRGKREEVIHLSVFWLPQDPATCCCHIHISDCVTCLLKCHQQPLLLPTNFMPFIHSFIVHIFLCFFGTPCCLLSPCPH